MTLDVFEDALDAARQGILVTDTGASDALEEAFLAVASSSGVDQDAAIARARELFAAD